MHGYVLTKAATGCLDPVLEGPTLSVGKTGSGSGTVTSDDGGITCGTDCSETYAQGPSPTVELTATAASGSEFTGWSGDCSGTAPTFTLTVDTDKSCTAGFDSSATCGNGVIDAGETCDGGDLGGETCSSQGCSGGTLACNATCDGFDLAGCSGCGCDFDGTCKLGEDCDNCASGTTSGAVCGNGLREAGNGESCFSCPADCRGKRRGNPNNRYCCEDDPSDPGCDEPGSVCNSGGYRCSTTPSSASSYCCGDDVCDSGESCSNCSLDCAQAGDLRRRHRQRLRRRDRLQRCRVQQRVCLLQAEGRALPATE